MKHFYAYSDTKMTIESQGKTVYTYMCEGGQDRFSPSVKRKVNHALLFENHIICDSLNSWQI